MTHAPSPSCLEPRERPATAPRGSRGPDRAPGHRQRRPGGCPDGGAGAVPVGLLLTAVAEVVAALRRPGVDPRRRGRRGHAALRRAGRVARHGHQRSGDLRPADRRVRARVRAGPRQAAAREPRPAARQGVAAPGDPSHRGRDRARGRHRRHRPGDGQAAARGRHGGPRRGPQARPPTTPTSAWSSPAAIWPPPSVGRLRGQRGAAHRRPRGAHRRRRVRAPCAPRRTSSTSAAGPAWSRPTWPRRCRGWLDGASLDVFAHRAAADRFAALGRSRCSSSRPTCAGTSSAGGTRWRGSSSTTPNAG